MVDTEKEIRTTNKEKNRNMAVWATSLKGIIKLNKKEKSLVPDTQVVYSRPPTILNMVTNYRSFSNKNGEDGGQKKIGSIKCGKCGLCGNYGKLKNMVVECKEIERKDGYRIKIKDSITCKDSGIYAGKCKVCGDIYVGQTKNRFSQRWSAHRAAWREMVNGCGKDLECNDRCALFLHYMKCHKDAIWNGDGMDIWEAFEVVFVERTTGARLDTAESFWISKLKARINVCGTFLPKIK
jgi:hypothetical protein